MPRRRLQRPPLRIWIWTAGAVVLVVVLALLWRNSDARATSSTTATAPSPVTGAPGAALMQAWSATGGPLPEQVVAGGRVIVGSLHGVTALDPSTGREAWHYLRSNTRMCALTATDGVAVAVFRTGDRCDQVVALRGDTGVRAWTRNVNFRPDVRLTSTPGHVFAVSPTGVVDLDPIGDNIRWRYNPPSGCRLADARGGTAGIAVLQRCPDASASVLLLDPASGQQRWTHVVAAGADVRLAGADWLVTLVSGDQLQVLSLNDGRSQQVITLPSGTSGTPLESAVDDAVLVWTHGTLCALDRTSGQMRWNVAALGLPGVQVGGTEPPPNSTVIVPESGAFVVRDLVTGAETSRSTSSGVPTGGAVTAVGPTVVYRLSDRVLGYR